MRSNMDIDPIRYRSAALGHAYLMAKDKGLPLKGLPEGILDGLGISVKDGLCTTFDVTLPKGMGTDAIRHRMEHFEMEMRSEMPKKDGEGGKRPKKAADRIVKDPSQEAGVSEDEEASVFRAFPGLIEGLPDDLDQVGDPRFAAIGRR